MPCRAYISYVVKHLIWNHGSKFATTDQEPSKTNLKAIFAISIVKVLHSKGPLVVCLRNQLEFFSYKISAKFVILYRLLILRSAQKF